MFGLVLFKTTSVWDWMNILSSQGLDWFHFAPAGLHPWESLHHSFKESLCSAHSVPQAWVPWRMGPVAMTTASASTALMASTEAVSSCACSSWLLWRTTQRCTTSRCSAGKNRDHLCSLKWLQMTLTIQNKCCYYRYCSVSVQKWSLFWGNMTSVQTCNHEITIALKGCWSTVFWRDGWGFTLALECRA